MDTVLNRQIVFTNNTNNINITLDGFNIVILEKNAKAYKKMTGMNINPTAIKVYIEAFCQEKYNDAIKSLDNYSINQIVNRSIQTEVEDICGKDFYESI